MLNQTYRNYEILVVNGVSQDNTKEVVERFNDPRIHLIIQTTDHGVSTARNIGIKCSKGEYIAFLDDDDLWMPLKLEKQVSLLESNIQVGAVYVSSCFYLFENKKLLYFSLPSIQGSIYPRVLEYNCIGNCSAVMVRRSCFDEVGLFDENLKAVEDWDMWIRLGKKFEFHSIDDPLYVYRIHKKRLSKTHATQLQETKKVFDKFLPEANISINRPAILKQWHLTLGHLYLQCGDRKLARCQYAKATEIDPKFVSCYFRYLSSFLGSRFYNLLISFAVSVRLVFPE